MAKSKEEMLEMSHEDLVNYSLEQAKIKSDMTLQQSQFKSEIKNLKTDLTKVTNQYDEATSKLNEFTVSNTKAELSKKLNDFNIQEKFVDDVISKSNLTLDMEEQSFNEAVSKTLETYPEYKSQPSTVNVEIKEDTTVDVNQAYRDAIKGNKK